METPKDKKYFKNIKNILAVSNKIALSAMKEAGKNSDWQFVFWTRQCPARQAWRGGK